MNDKVTHGALRKTLFNQLKLATEGKVSRDDGKAIIGMANQISHNLTAELKAREQQIRIGIEVEKLGKIGSLPIG